MGQKYVKRGQKGPKWANTDQKGVEIDQKDQKRDVNGSKSF